MSCLISSGWKLNCRKLTSGIRNIYVIPFNKIISYAINSDEIITNVNTNNEPFFVFEVPKDNAELVEKQILDDNTGIISWQTSFKFGLSKNNYQLRKLYLQLLNGRYTFIIRDGMGLYWILGKNYGMDVFQSEVSPGKVNSDFNGNKLEFIANESEPMRQVLSTAFIQSNVFSNPSSINDPQLSFPQSG